MRKSADLRVLHIRAVLRGDDHVGDSDQLVALVDHRDLALRIRPQPLHAAALADLGELASQAMRKHDRRRHQLGRLVAGVAKHQALIAGALLGVILPIGSASSTPCAMSGRLRGDDVLHEDAIRVEDVVVIHVADLADGIAHDLFR